jgi:hypothetical protein
VTEVDNADYLDTLDLFSSGQENTGSQGLRDRDKSKGSAVTGRSEDYAVYI